MLTELLLAIVIISFVIFYRQRRQQMTIFKELGLPGPEPNFLFGNLLYFLWRPLYISFQNWCKIYGKTYGYFEGPTPVIVSSDMDFLQEVFVKQFKNFHARKVYPVQVDPDQDENVHMFFARGERWRRLRSIVNPAFSTSKMKDMMPTINKRVNELMDIVEEKRMENQHFDMYELFQRLTLDTIADCGFGLKSESLTSKDDVCLQNCRNVIKDTTKRPILFMLGFVFPTFHSLWISIYNILRYISFNPVFWLEDNMARIVKERKSKKASRVDLLQLMVTSEFDPTAKTSEDDADSIDSVVKKRFLTNDELTAMCLLFLLAGYETTSTTLAYIMYEMAVNPEVQKKLQEEIDENFPDETEQPDFHALTKMEYLEMVWCETLRKFPLASTVVARQCMEPSKVQGIDIPSGMIVQANVWDIHYDPKIWGDNPEQFKPESEYTLLFKEDSDKEQKAPVVIEYKVAKKLFKFTPEARKNRHPMAWLPFGGGPRTCVGLRLAQLEGKMAIVKLFKKYSFYPSKKLDIPMVCQEGATIMPKNGVQVNVKLREHR